ncbi:hypothetical protein [Croceicoccus marinus]|uniref:Uncharacterized protein n=1 Tax=Croceicoccus marinus TaxID=450378 RepID=A0A7G6W147_9SPHN|nr:hypothetical protein [Croceicoccus marinus]QNE07712.1 hypothetical protein H4O24_20010 [Croceicoccus marinus]
MGLDDRDYMRERYRERQGLNKSPSRWSFNKAERAQAAANARKAKPKPSKETVWNDKKARREASKHDDTPLGSASWIGRNGGFDEYDRVAAAYSKRRRRRRTASRTSPGRSFNLPPVLIPVLCLASACVPIFADMRRGGWLPDLEPALPFPESGSVAVASDFPMKLVRSRLSVVTSDANAVVQMFDPENGRHAVSVFVAANSAVDVPAPIGLWRMRLIEGRKWHGPTKFFGPNTQFETVTELMEFTPSYSHTIDLNRRVDGNLKTRMMLTGPDPL